MRLWSVQKGAQRWDLSAETAAFACNRHFCRKAITGRLLSDWALVAVRFVQGAGVTGFKQLEKYCIDYYRYLQ